jgi:hypothetical protein
LTNLYLEHLEQISEVLNNSGVEYYVFKTVKPFPYDMTDIDIFFSKKKDMLMASDILRRKLGFKAVSKGTFSLTFRKTVHEFDIDVDLQSKISAGTFEYLSITEVKRLIDGIGYINNGIPVLKPEIEIIIIAGHAFYKDFAISLADIIYAVHLLRLVNKTNLNLVLRYNKHLIAPFNAICYIAKSLKPFFVDSFDFNCVAEARYDKMMNQLVERVFNELGECKGKIMIPTSLVVKGYLKTTSILLKEHRYAQLLGIAKIPQSRGIKQFFRRLRILPEEETIQV